MGCVVRQFNHLPRVRMAQIINGGRYGPSIRAYVPEAVLCVHGTASPVPPLEWPTLEACGVGDGELQIRAANGVATAKIVVD